MRTREIFRYELEHRLRSPATWAYAGFLFLVAMWMFLATADGGASAFANAPERLAGGAVVVGTVGMLVTAALFGDAAVRDVAVEMDPLLFTTPVRRAEYLGGRFLAALAVNAVLLVAIPLGFVAATGLVASMQSVGVGPFRVWAYVQAYALFLLPNLVLAGAILYTIGVLARRVVPVYVGALALFVGYLAVMNGVGASDAPVLSVLTDPLGMRTLQATTRYWTAAERNTRLVGLPAELLLNRAAWLAVAAGVLALLHHRFRLAHAGVGGRRRPARRAALDAPSARARSVALPRVAGTFDAATTARQTLAIARRSLGELVAGRWFAVALLGCAGLTVLMGWNVGETVFETYTWPATMLVGGTVLAERVSPIVHALVALCAGELVWQDRDANVDEIADAAPVPDGVALLGRFLALVVVVVLLQLALLAGGILIQALQGYHRFELGLYLRILFGFKLADYVLVGVLAMAIHVAVHHKYLGHVVLLLAVGGALFLRTLGLVRHHLLLYGTTPGWTYSDMNGFGPFLAPFVWFKLYWAAWALLIGVVAALLWVRGREPGVRFRIARARARFAGATVRVARVAVALILALGGFVLYSTRVLNASPSPAEAGRARAGYERRYKRYEDAPQPTIVAAELRVEIHPERPAVDLRGRFRLVNRTGVPIDSVHVLLADPGVQARALTFDRPATAVVTDGEAGYRIFALGRALAPGDSLHLAFDVTFRPRGFPNEGIRTEVVANGTNFDRRLMPIVGYQPAFELTDDEERRRFGLAPRAPEPGPDAVEARRRRWSLRDADLVQVSATVGTAADQIAVTPGVLRRSWTDSAAGPRGRRWFHYETETPTAFGGTVYSARYAVVDDRWVPARAGGPADDAAAPRPVALQVLHHPAHRDNVDRTVRSMKASLDYYTEQFGPYPYAQLRVVEFPRYGGYGVAHPRTIGFAEDYFLGRVRPGQADQPFYGTAHEVAHAWWGGMVRGAAVRGHGLLTESLANYSAMMVTERTYGVEAARRVYDFQMGRYLRGRATQGREVPLLDVTDQPYIAYRKGAIALYTLREHVGEARVNAALRRYFERHRAGVAPYPTSRDLYAELRAVTPDSLRGLLADLFETVTIWDVETTGARVEPTGTGAYRVAIDVVARKARADSVGNLREVPMDDLVEIGVFAPGEGDARGVPLHLQRHRIRSGPQTITVTVPRAPARAGVDPFHRLIDRDREDNVVAIGG